jgi:hypothetical protein
MRNWWLRKIGNSIRERGGGLSVELYWKKGKVRG